MLHAVGSGCICGRLFQLLPSLEISIMCHACCPQLASRLHEIFPAHADMANVWAYFRHPSGPAAALGPDTSLLDSLHESVASGPGLPLPRRRSSPLPTAVYTNGSGSKGKQT